MLKRLMTIAGVAFALVMGTMTVACGATASGPVRILIVGDSVTHGSNGDYTWRYFAWKGLQATGANVDFVGPHDGTNLNDADPFGGTYADPNFDHDHAAIWGQAIWQTFDHGSDANHPGIADMVAAYQPDIIVTQLGFNDGTWGGASGQTIADLQRTFIEQARSAKPDVDFVVGALPQTWQPNLAAYDALLPAFVAEMSTPASRVVTTTYGSFVQGVDTYDPAHPTTSGQIKIATAISGGLEQLGVGRTYVASVPAPVETPTTPPASHQPQAPAAVKLVTPRLRAHAQHRGWVRLRWTRVASEGTRVWFRDVTTHGRWTRLYVDIAKGRTGYRMQLDRHHKIAFRAAAVGAQGISKTSHVVKVRTR